MPDLNAILVANRDAVNEMLAAADTSGASFTTPRAPGKWSPSQVVEHVARALEESAKLVDGVPTKFPKLPAIMRPLLRIGFFNRVLKNKWFPKAKTNPALNPASGPPTPAAARVRLQEAASKFDRSCRAREGQKVASTVFGTVTVEDYARFQELHVRHHRKQIPAPTATT
jgi:hypothetical protein